MRQNRDNNRDYRNSDNYNNNNRRSKSDRESRSRNYKKIVLIVEIENTPNQVIDSTIEVTDSPIVDLNTEIITDPAAHQETKIQAINIDNHLILIPEKYTRTLEVILRTEDIIKKIDHIYDYRANTVYPSRYCEPNQPDCTSSRAPCPQSRNDTYQRRDCSSLVLREDR